MNREEHLVTILGEEGAEVAQRCSKILRFGAAEIQPGQEAINAERLKEEVADLVAVFEMLTDEFPITFKSITRSQVEAKKQKVEKYLAYSKECGTLA